MRITAIIANLLRHPIFSWLRATRSTDEALPVRQQAAAGGGDQVVLSKAFEQVAAAYNNGDWSRAEQLCRLMLTASPDYFDALNLLGIIAAQTRRPEEAAKLLGRAVGVRPDDASALNNLGNLLIELRRFDQALECLDKAISLEPDLPGIHSNRGIALRELGQLRAAIGSFDLAIRIKPDHAEAYSNRGIALKALRQLDAAIASYDRAIAIKPDLGQAHWNKAIALLLRGRFEQGWRLYEWGWNTGDRGGNRQFTQPLWLGVESLKDKTILLVSEQGLGDTIQFCRYARLVADLGARVVMEVPESLRGLLDQLDGVAQVLAAGGSLPAFDYYCPLMSLPLAFKTTGTSIPAPPSLKIESGKIAVWSDRLGARTRPRIGLAWSGRAAHKNDRNRSILLADLVKHLPGQYQYVSLQKELREADAQTLSENNIVHFGTQLTDFTDTAALCGLMDVVISVDTSVAHLAGSMGKAVWILLPWVPDWRWLLDRNDSPWYPTAQLFRQERAGDWAGALARVRVALEALA